VMVWENDRNRGRPQSVVSTTNFLDWKEQNDVFEDMAAFYDTPFNLTGVADPEEIPGQRVTANMFDLLGAHAMLGRTFAPEETVPELEGKVILSYGLWQRRFGADPAVIGQAIHLNANVFTVIGVMPPDYQLFVKKNSLAGARPEIWAAMGFDKEDRVRRGRYIIGVARLKDGVTLAQAQGQMDALAAELERQYPDFNAGWGISLVPFREQFAGEMRRPLYMLMGAVALVLLIACANVANLLLARAASRQKEIAIRMAVGASRTRIIRQLLIESILLALLGGAAGLLLAMWGVDALVALSPKELLPATGARINLFVLGFTLLVSLVTGVLFGLAPALEASRTNLNETLKEGGRTAMSGGRSHHLRNLFVVAEVAMALLLLVGAGLLVKSFVRLQSVNPGFDPKDLLTVRLRLPYTSYPDPQQRVRFFRDAVARLRQVPGVRSASAISFLPFAGPGTGAGYSVEGRPFPRPGEWPVVDVRACDADYFQTMGIALLKGRSFSEREQTVKSHVVVINETLAREMFPGEEPIGKRLIIQTVNNPPACEIIGVVGDVKHGGFDSQVRAMSYWPYVENEYLGMTLVARTDGDPMAYVTAVRREVQALDNDQPIASVYTMEQLLAESVARARFITTLLALFAGIALTLAAVGIYGVMSYSVTQRTHEIGIRMALGAGQAKVMRMVIRQGMTLALAGVATGLVAALTLTRLLASLLFGVSATDPATFIAIPLVLAGVALGACFVPARRATRVDPMVALRYE
ncbi:MAG TPA: ABC transporter permease, partial [Blastocatellia bacterium]|nr:ABC transporter permease [Blastocatellia bacterium]